MKIRKILIGIDESEFSRYAASYAFDIAHTYSAEVGLVHIVEPVVMPVDTQDGLLGTPFEPNLNLPGTELETLQTERSATLLNQTAKEWGEGLQIAHFTHYGSTADGIIECSKEFDADLIVLGTHRRTGIDKFFLGNVAEQVINKSLIPVLVVPYIEAKH
ncbi:universal stress protein [Mucilaginibacter sp. SMC90]|uniref:universal stress protein n=1 Tax=Mucilaginibacter sp. SMC90 TaxID=2929803 RepID=UPI001FB38A81|nr:universal stress protein [Mucilaginibacter sp. SMC90]UOE50152.1 universal stress protein [Mucilaginibacter sp. SMC90]